MGTVYRSRDMNFNAIRLVAIKEMISQASDPKVQKNIEDIYERESNILATLRHHSIPRIYDYFTTNNRAYLVMEFISGRDLDSILEDTKSFFTEQQVIAWGIDLCDVLSYLHSHQPEPIIFRDMKPSNIMINSEKHPILVDFGIAKVFEMGDKNTMVGTEGYSPPDQYRGESTPMVDTYALGATLHHILTLKDPREEAPFSFDERPIKDFSPTVSDDLIELIEKSLQYNKADRYQTANEMKGALISIARKFSNLNEGGKSTRSVSSEGTSGMKPQWTFECEDEIRGTPILSKGILYTGCYDNNLYALNAKNGEFIWKYATKGGIPGKPAIFDNNIYFGSEDNHLHMISSRTGKNIWSYKTDGPVRSSPVLAQGHVFIGSDDNHLHVVNSTTGRLSWKFEATASIRSTAYISDDRIYFGTENGEFYCLNFGGEIKWRIQAKRAITSSPTIYNQIAYFTSLDGYIYAIDAISGWSIWQFRLGKGSVSSPIVVDNKLFAGAADNVIYCIDIKTSKEVWRFTTDHQVAGSPVVFKDNIYCGSVDGKMYSINMKTGQLRWLFSSNGPITGSPVTTDDMVYFGSADKTIYALLA